VERTCGELGVSQRRACQVLTQPRTTQRYVLEKDLVTEVLIGKSVELAGRYGRCWYQRVMALLKSEGWKVNQKKVERIWRMEGLKVPQ
jgi:hypothetical protein